MTFRPNTFLFLTRKTSRVHWASLFSNEGLKTACPLYACCVLRTLLRKPINTTIAVIKTDQMLETVLTVSPGHNKTVETVLKRLHLEWFTAINRGVNVKAFAFTADMI